MNKLPNILILVTVILDYAWLFWFRDESLFIHLNGISGFPMYWHVHELGMMINFITLGCILNLLSKHIIFRSYLFWQIALTAIYLAKGPSLNETERVLKASLFFVFLLLFWINERRGNK